jgi:small subunit ribosomal protein S3
MGQKVHPLALRLGFIKNWHSIWFAKSGDYPKFIEEDYRIRAFIKKNFKHAAISKIVIERLAERIKIRIFSARPGVIIGKHGADIEGLRENLNSLVKKEISIDIEEIKDPKGPELDGQLVAESVAMQLEKRVAFRRAIKRVISQAVSKGAQGIKVSVAGRLGGAEMSRRETYREGKVPLQTLRADIDYGFAEALTTYGLIGVKVWIYKGDVLIKKHAAQIQGQSPDTTAVK